MGESRGQVVRNKVCGWGEGIGEVGGGEKDRGRRGNACSWCVCFCVRDVCREVHVRKCVYVCVFMLDMW